MYEYWNSSRISLLIWEFLSVDSKYSPTSIGITAQIALKQCGGVVGVTVGSRWASEKAGPESGEKQNRLTWGILKMYGKLINYIGDDNANGQGMMNSSLREYFSHTFFTPNKSTQNKSDRRTSSWKMQIGRSSKVSLPRCGWRRIVSAYFTLRALYDVIQTRIL